MNPKNLISRKNLIFATVTAFGILAALITIGMLTPLVVQLLSGMQIGMDATYFNNRAGPIAGLLVILLCACLLVTYISGRYIGVLLGSIVLLSALMAVLSPVGNMLVDISIIPMIAVFAASLYRLVDVIRNRSGKSRFKGIGAHVIHIGILLVIFGTIFSSAMKVEDSAVVSIGEETSFEGIPYSVSVMGMASNFEGTPYDNYPGSSYATNVGLVISKNGNEFDRGTVRYITDIKWRQTYTSTYINRGIMEEVFIAPKALDENSGEVDLYLRVVPFIGLLWAGIYIMLGGMCILLLGSTVLKEGEKEVAA
ncbi:cytochrome c-type biogenesis CcmF C-terminal domain-containing protein [Methanohalophilus mahii]|uniref:Cytochrome c biogenesis factor n=1 Tax=Methanohalophilus mahii (strain ATCC 35705 / DSM 5219 / SLP) TaxID=547558 RepID=D5EAD1_METMS|nr:cytochrome c-type biogenesis CcmF C-terminal domain-containing protein [Methanohalophilus mahii]ADE36132.1 Cytochrome c biogenesis factor [Methanohalophilus mahii DSM 5219]